MKNFDQNLRGDQPQHTVTELNKKRFQHKYGDRSGIWMWGFHEKINFWLVKSKSNTVAYYKHQNDFSSLSKVDLSELSATPFYNPSNDPHATNFKTFLENQVRRGFDGMKTIESFLKTAKGVYDPITNKSIKNVMWPPTKQLTKIPITKNFCYGTLCNMLYWVYDEATTSVVTSDR